MDVTSSSSSRTILDPTFSNTCDNYSEEIVLSPEKKAEDAVVKAKADYTEAVSGHRIFDNKVIEIRSLNHNHNKVYTFGVSWFDLNKDQEVVVGQHIKFASLDQVLFLCLPSDLKDLLKEEYEILKVTPVYSDGKVEELAPKLAAECEAKCEVEEAFNDEKLALKLACEVEEAFDDEKLALKLAAECEVEEAFYDEKLVLKLVGHPAWT